MASWRHGAMKATFRSWESGVARCGLPFVFAAYVSRVETKRKERPHAYPGILPGFAADWIDESPISWAVKRWMLFFAAMELAWASGLSIGYICLLQPHVGSGIAEMLAVISSSCISCVQHIMPIILWAPCRIIYFFLVSTIIQYWSKRTALMSEWQGWILSVYGQVSRMQDPLLYDPRAISTNWGLYPTILQQGGLIAQAEVCLADIYLYVNRNFHCSSNRLYWSKNKGV